MEFKLAEEPAKVQLKKLCDYYRIPEGDLDENSEKKLVKFIRLGQLEIGTDGVVTQTLLDAGKNVNKTVNYGRVTGSAYTAMSAKSLTDMHGRMYAMLGSMSGLGELPISQFSGTDIACANALGTFFLVAAS